MPRTKMLPAAEGRCFGWKPPFGALDHKRQSLHQFSLQLPAVVAPHVDLRPSCPPVYDQGAYSACTANAVAGMIHYFRIKEGLPNLMPSRLFIYWFERLSTGDQGQDVGGSIGAAIEAAVGSGYCSENTWPYIDADLLTTPSAEAVAEGAKKTVSSPASLTGLQQIKYVLSRGQPVAFGLRLYNSFFEADLNQGIVPMPDTTGANEKHAGLLVGYDDGSQRLIMRNSWGLKTSTGRPCGDRGYYYLPYEYIGGSLSTDFWTIGSVIDAP